MFDGNAQCVLEKPNSQTTSRISSNKTLGISRLANCKITPIFQDENILSIL